MQQFTILKNHNLPPRVIKYLKENDKFSGNLFNVTHVLNIFKFYFIMEISIKTPIKILRLNYDILYMYVHSYMNVMNALMHEILPDLPTKTNWTKNLNKSMQINILYIIYLKKKQAIIIH
jgi:hypothetical protein